MAKRVYAKTYDSSGNFKGLFINFNFSAIAMSINSGVADLTLQLPAKFDDYGEGTTISKGYMIKLYVSDGDAPSGRLIYSGWIGATNTSVSDTESVTIKAYGYIARLQMDLVKSGSTLIINKNSTDPSQIIKDLIDLFRTANSGTPINYSASTISTTGKSVSLRFDSIQYLKAIDQIRKLANADWFFYLDVDNLLYFSQLPATATHLLTFERDVHRLEFEGSIVESTNTLIFWNGRQQDEYNFIGKEYKDATAQTAYGRNVEIKKDARYTVPASADEYGNRFIAAYKDPINTVSVIVLDNNYYQGGYDIESFKPGQTVKIRNLSSSLPIGTNNIITKVTNYLSYAELQIADSRQFLDRNIFELSQELENEQFNNGGLHTYS